MFENLSSAQWVALAWLQLAVAYGGYLAYLAGRRRQLERRAEAMDGTTGAPGDAPDGGRR